MPRIVGKREIVGALSLAFFFVLWESMVRLNVYRFGLLPAPIQSLHATLDVLTNQNFLRDVWYSTYRVWVAWFMACIIAIPVGLFIGWSRRVALLCFPALEVLRPIPPIAWIPASILFFPSVEPSVVFICFVGAFFPILLNAKAGVDQIDARYFHASRCLGAGAWLTFWDVVLPGALPSIFTGLAVGMGVAWMAVVAAEMIAGEFGLGYMIWHAYALTRYPVIVVGMVVIAILGFASSVIIRLVGARVLRWHGSSI